VAASALPLSLRFARAIGPRQRRAQALCPAPLNLELRFELQPGPQPLGARMENGWTRPWLPPLPVRPNLGCAAQPGGGWWPQPTSWCLKVPLRPGGAAANQLGSNGPARPSAKNSPTTAATRGPARFARDASRPHVNLEPLLALPQTQTRSPPQNGPALVSTLCVTLPVRSTCPMAALPLNPRL